LADYLSDPTRKGAFGNVPAFAAPCMCVHIKNKICSHARTYVDKHIKHATIYIYVYIYIHIYIYIYIFRSRYTQPHTLEMCTARLDAWRCRACMAMSFLLVASRIREIVVMRMWGNYGQRARHALQSNSASNDRGNYRERHYTQMCCVFM
jgi:hypothetical protein